VVWLRGWYRAAALRAIRMTAIALTFAVSCCAHHVNRLHFLYKICMWIGVKVARMAT